MTLDLEKLRAHAEKVRGYTYTADFTEKPQLEIAIALPALIDRVMELEAGLGDIQQRVTDALCRNGDLRVALEDLLRAADIADDFWTESEYAARETARRLLAPTPHPTTEGRE